MKTGKPKLGLFAGCLCAPLLAGASVDPTVFSMEELLGVTVSSASRYEQQGADVPAAVTVLTAADIRSFGWRTLADALQTVPGLYVNNDRSYSYIGVRGFAPTGDYNDRLLVLIDGNRINDNIFDQGFIGSEFPLDLDLVERIEVVRGPSSSMYGANALFGVVNVITRRSADVAGEAALMVGSYGERSGRISLGRTLENGADVLLSASASARRGDSADFPEFGASSPASASRERGQRLFARWRLDGWEAELIHAYRDKGLSTGSYGTDFQSDASASQDRNTLLSLRKRESLSLDLDFTGRLFFGEYRYTGQYLSPAPGSPLNRDRSVGQWWGGEGQWDYTGWKGHRLVGGVEFQRNQRQDQLNYDTVVWVDSRQNGYRLGVFLQDEIKLTPQMALTVGVRRDQADKVSAQWNPRLALVYRPEATRTLKLNYSSAFRAANVYERYYGAGQTINPNLHPEKIRTIEGLWEETLSPATRLTASLYVFRLNDQISQVPDVASGELVFINADPVTVRGGELGVEHLWSGGTRLRASWATQWARQAGQWTANAPRHLLKANLSMPFGGGWFLGAEMQGTSAAATTAGSFPNYTLDGRIGGHAIANATLRYAPSGQPWELRLGAYNLFDHRYGEPAPPDPYAEAIFLTAQARQAYPGAGRTLRLDGVFHF